MEFEEQCYKPKCAIENSKFVKAFSKTKPDAKIRLFCCHHGGGSFNDFRKWEKMIGPDIQVCAIVLPGHIGRMDEPFMTNLHDEAKVTLFFQHDSITLLFCFFLIISINLSN